MFVMNSSVAELSYVNMLVLGVAGRSIAQLQMIDHYLLEEGLNPLYGHPPLFISCFLPPPPPPTFDKSF